MTNNMVLIGIDELGDEFVAEYFTVGYELDDDYLELWKDIKIQKYREEYPECHFYFEDRRDWQRQINQSIREFFR